MHGRRGYCRWNSFSLNRGTRNICSPVWILFWLALLLRLKMSDDAFSTRSGLFLLANKISWKRSFWAEKVSRLHLIPMFCMLLLLHPANNGTDLQKKKHIYPFVCSRLPKIHLLFSFFLYLSRVWKGTKTQQNKRRSCDVAKFWWMCSRYCWRCRSNTDFAVHFEGLRTSAPGDLSEGLFKDTFFFPSVAILEKNKHSLSVELICR